MLTKTISSNSFYFKWHSYIHNNTKNNSLFNDMFVKYRLSLDIILFVAFYSMNYGQYCCRATGFYPWISMLSTLFAGILITSCLLLFLLITTSLDQDYDCQWLKIKYITYQRLLKIPKTVTMIVTSYNDYTTSLLLSIPVVTGNFLIHI